MRDRGLAEGLCHRHRARWRNGRPVATRRLVDQLDIAEGTGRFDRDQRKFLVTARGSTLECGAILDAMRALGLDHAEVEASDLLLVRIVSMLTKMIG